MNILKSWLPSGTKDQGAESATAQLKVENPSEGGEDHGMGAEYENARGDSLWKVLSSKLGGDIIEISGLSLPIWLFEPYSALQRMCEMLDFAQLLNEAALLEDPLDRMAYVAIFAVSGYNSTERFGKPFNPVLGETFELEDKERNFRFIAEQVSHHPPVSACHASNEHFEWWQESRPRTKFNGNSVDLETSAKTHIYFPKTRDHFVFTNPTTRVNNLIIGRLWMDHFGQLAVKNLRTGDVCNLTFEKCGWLSRGRYEVSGYVKTSEGKETHYISGKWNESMSVKWVRDAGQPKGTTKVLWTKPEVNSFGKYKATKFALSLNEMDEEYQKLLPSSDSRIRPDRVALDGGDSSGASSAKHKIEERQRADRKARAAQNVEWTPRWFKQIPEEDGESSIWVYCGDYWERREKKRNLLAKEKESKKDVAEEATETDGSSSDPAVVIQEDLLSENISRLACDFRSFG